jgi:hypothetical protein
VKREIKTGAELRDMILVEARNYPDVCGDSSVGVVLQQEPDETGCDWIVSPVGGPEWKACLKKLEPFVAELRSKYNLLKPEYD